jgi:hypothetical protein
LRSGSAGIDARFEPAAFAHDLGEQLELPHGAAALAFEARARKPRLEHRALDERRRRCRRMFCAIFSRKRARSSSEALAIGVEGRPRQSAHAPGRARGTRAAVMRLERLAGRRVGPVESPRQVPATAASANQHLA